MQQSYKAVYEGGQGEIIEKKSRFIATVKKTETVEEAEAFINECKKKYWDARHNCSAFIIGENAGSMRSSDDGEPSGTAGKPMLEVLMGEEICNVTVVVTRYFGGVLLGTGGLVRAYQKAVKAGLSNSTIVIKESGIKLNIKTDYNDIGKLQYLLGRNSFPILDSVYTEAVELTTLVPLDKKDFLIKEITEATSGKAIVEEGDEVFFGMVNGHVELFDK